MYVGIAIRGRKQVANYVEMAIIHKPALAPASSDIIIMFMRPNVCSNKACLQNLILIL